MNIRPIKTRKDHEAALRRIDQLMDARANTPEGDELDVWVMLVEVYEAKHHPIAPPDPVDAIRFYMDQRGLVVKDLEPYIGGRSRVWEVLNRKRPLTLAMIRNLHQGLNIPLNSLIGKAA
jgi:HTH-type transcriptional regulator/antitoxin HigA